MRSLKQFLVFLTVTGLASVIGIQIGNAENKTWTYGGVEYRLPAESQELQLPAGIPEYHTVVSGDSLWAISRSYLNDPFLWPLVWEENLDTIQNPHRIYPNDIVRLPGGAVMTPGMTATGETTRMPARTFTTDTTSSTTAEVTSIEGAAAAARESTERKPFAVISEADLISAGMITRDKLSGPEIIAAETTSFDLSFDDIVFVDGGPGKGIVQGSYYYIMRELHDVKHPVSGRKLGKMYHVMAEAEILCADENVSSARISKSYSAVLRGDFLVPREEIAMPLTFGSPPLDRCNPSSRKMPGAIVDAYIGGGNFSDAVALAKGDVAYIDLGSQDGVVPGDYFTIFTRDADDPRLPRFVSGEIMVAKVFESTSVVVVTQSKTAVFMGDMIELKQ